MDKYSVKFNAKLKKIQERISKFVVERMEKELEELQGRILKLQNFLKHPSITDDEKLLWLGRQYDVMQQYEAILIHRIKLERGEDD